MKLVSKRKGTGVEANGLYHHRGLVEPALSLSAAKAGTATVRVVDTASGAVVASLPLHFDSAGTGNARWSGQAAAGGYVADSTYRFNLADPGSAQAAITGGQSEPFRLRRHGFPVPGPHSYGGSGSRFGAPRSGHTHQGQDMAAACGERLYASETGQVAAKAYQASGAGHYLVIQGTVTGTAHVYMHLMKASWAQKGQTVYAGQQIGKVGTTGSSTGCHLHFERWTAPGWYVGGKPYDPLPELRYWDAYS